MDYKSDWKRMREQESRDRIVIILGITFLVFSLIATLYMYHENSVVSTMIRLSK